MSARHVGAPPSKLRNRDPPMRTFSKRRLVQIPANNIGDGEVSAERLNRLYYPPIKPRPTVDRATKYSRSKKITDKINDVLSLQPPTTFRLALKCRKGFQTALHTGKLEEFTGQETTCEPPQTYNEYECLRPQLEIIHHSTRAIEETNNISLLARWDKYGYATYKQWELVEAVVTANNNFEYTGRHQDKTSSHQKYTKFIQNYLITFTYATVCTRWVTKTFVEDLNLGRWYVGKYEQHGIDFLHFRENVWLHTGWIFVLHETYQGVGNINPRFLHFETIEQRMQIAGSYGAAEPGVKSVLTTVTLTTMMRDLC